MTTLLLVCAYTLYAIGVYRGALRHGWKPTSTWRGRWRTRVKVAALAAIWPYLIGKGNQIPTVITGRVF